VDEVERSAPSAQPQQEPPKSDGDTEGSVQAGNESVDAGSQVMGRLPRTRPQRRSGRRPAAPAKTEKSKPSSPASARQRTVTGARSRATASPGARSRPAANRRKPAETATRAAARKRAPGASQFAFDLAVEAAKLPLKVTADVTRRATNLIGRGLRLR
jgi:hypothetical protein